MKTRSKVTTFALTTLFIACLAACGGGGDSGSSASSNSPTPTPVVNQQVNVPFLISDASSEDWATIGVQLLGVTLTKNDGTTVTVPLGTSPAPLNLAQLDQLGQILSNVSLNPGDTYTGATLTISANPGDVSLIVSADPEAGFTAAPGTVIPSSQIQIQGASGATGSKTVTVPVKFATPFVVPAAGSSASPAIDIEVDLNHPAFIVNHVPANGGAPVWAVNFNGPVHHHPVNDITSLVLRHMYGTVNSISSDNSSVTVTRELPAAPVTSPETAVATNATQTILADSTNGTLFYDLDGKTSSTIKDFSSVASILASGENVRIAARYQQNGTLVATRIWASKSFSTVWVSPEGHVLHVDLANNQIVVADENGKPVPLAIGPNTQFFFRTPANALADVTPIGTGTAFLTNNIERGFKVHAQVVDPLASPMLAQTIDIETAAFEGTITSPTATGFTFTKMFHTKTDDYSLALNFISSASPNGKDSIGNPITGFKYWNFAYPTLVNSGPNAVSSFDSATNGNINFGGSVGQVWAQGATYARWGDATANISSGWVSPWVVLEPSTMPRATVASTLSSNNVFTITVPGGTNAVPVSVSNTSGSATLVYQVDRTNGIVTVTPQDITTQAGMTALTTGLATGAQVKVSAVPQADGSLKAYVLDYYTGTAPQ